LLAHAGLRITSHVFTLGSVSLPDPGAVDFTRASGLPDDAPLRCVDADLERQMIAEIDRAREAGDTLGGAFEVIATGVPVGLGSYVQWDRKLDGRLAQALMSIPAIKAVGIGIGPAVASLPGSRVHDEIVIGDESRATGLARPTNRAGGLEGGVTNGEDLRVSAYMKPISTLMKPLRSVDLSTMAESPAAIERSDVCAVPAAAVVGEAMVSLVLADALLERFGGDSIAALDRAMASTDETVRTRFRKR
jgi:chorismate synthase